MEMDTESSVAQSYTILRIKRKRNEEPLDALVVESRVRRKRSRGGIGVFQFAQTVENDAWQDERRQKDIQDQITRLAREASALAEKKTIANLSGTSSPSLVKAQKEDRHYTILKQDGPDVETKKHPTSPPKVISAKDLPPKKLNPDFKMYDAVLATEKTAPPSLDPEMDNFLPMLNDYLKLHDVTSETLPQKGAISGLPSSGSKVDDYVWDVFYHRPATLSEWNEAANVGTLSGLPPSITDPYDSASESEEEDEADEDSNAEEYYKNDYPEDEEDSSDEFHESSDYEDMMNNDDDGADHDWR